MTVPLVDHATGKTTVYFPHISIPGLPRYSSDHVSLPTLRITSITLSWPLSDGFVPQDRCSMKLSR
jgi:hypothetical protein